MGEVFGQILDGSHVQAAALATLELWLPDYLREVERTHRLPQGIIPAPRSWGIAGGDVDDWFTHASPAVLVRSDGAPDTRRGAEHYNADWQLDIVVAVSASVQNRAAPLVLAQRYGGAVRGALLHHPDLGGFALATVWDEVQIADAMVKGEARALVVESFTVTVANVISRFGGPVAPSAGRPSPDSPDWPTPRSVEIDIEREELTP